MSALLGWQKINGVKQTVEISSVFWWPQGWRELLVFSYCENRWCRQCSLQVNQTFSGCHHTHSIMLPAALTVFNESAGDAMRVIYIGWCQVSQLTMIVWNATVVLITGLRSWCYMFTRSDICSDIPHCSWTAPSFLVASTWEKQRDNICTVEVRVKFKLCFQTFGGGGGLGPLKRDCKIITSVK